MTSFNAIEEKAKMMIALHRARRGFSPRQATTALASSVPAQEPADLSVQPATPSRLRRGAHIIVRASTVYVLVLVGCMLAPQLAHADFGVVPGSFSADLYKQDGTLETAAGAHPYRATTNFDFNQMPDGLHLDGTVRDIHIHLPPGFVGNPQAAPKCTRANFNGIIDGSTTCPVASQVGVTTIRVMLPGGAGVGSGEFPVYNLEPQAGVTADFGIPVLTVPVHILATADTAGDYGLNVDLPKVSEGIPLAGSTLSLWGVPSDPSHDAQRACGGGYVFGTPCPVDSPRTPFLTAPTSCVGPQTSSMTVDSWANPGSFSTTSYRTSVGADGCDELHFTPSLSINPDSAVQGAPTGLSVDLSVAHADDPSTGLAPGTLRNVTVTLPQGMSISPSAPTDVL
jgi:hypothetical protein